MCNTRTSLNNNLHTKQQRTRCEIRIPEIFKKKNSLSLLVLNRRTLIEICNYLRQPVLLHVAAWCHCTGSDLAFRITVLRFFLRNHNHHVVICKTAINVI